jgi:hypothetical protein
MIKQRMTNIVNLPEDLVKYIFTFIWRYDVKGIPLTCKIFHQIVNSPRYFKGWKSFTITIRSPYSQGARVKYDHFDTLSVLLQRFLFENLRFPGHDHVSSLYGISKHSNTPQPFCDPRNNVLFALLMLPQENQHILYKSNSPWKQIHDTNSHSITHECPLNK